MKVLQVNSLFREGSTGKIIDDISVVLQQHGFESVVCYARGKRWKSEPYVYKIANRVERRIHRYANALFGILMYGGLYKPTQRLIRIIEIEKPDVVHLHCINGNSVNIYKLLTYLGLHKINTIITNHGEFFYTGSCGHSFDCNKWKTEPGCGKCPRLLISTGSYFFDWTRLAWKKMRKAFSHFDKERIIIVSVSPWVQRRSLQSPIVKNYNHTVVLNGVNTDVFRYYEDNNIYNSKKKYKTKKIVFHATASFEPEDLDNLKGAKYILELAQQMPDVCFVVAAIDYKISRPLPKNIIFWGPAKTQIELAHLYSAADCTLLVSKRETFSMPTAETLCCGTPIVGFKAGGPESFAPQDVTEFVDFGDVAAMKTALEKMLDSSFDKKQISEKAISFFNKEVMAYRYIKLYKKMYETNKNSK